MPWLEVNRGRTFVVLQAPVLAGTCNTGTGTCTLLCRTLSDARPCRAGGGGGWGGGWGGGGWGGGGWGGSGWAPCLVAAQGAA
jgi:hypothetical protein